MNKDLRILAEDIVDFCVALESTCVRFRLQIERLLGREVKAKIPEDRFNVLKWKEEKGTRLGDFQVAYANHNVPESWSHAFTVLKANNSFIANPFHEDGYEFGYWIYPEKYLDRVFRKRLSEAKS